MKKPTKKAPPQKPPRGLSAIAQPQLKKIERWRKAHCPEDSQLEAVRKLIDTGLAAHTIVGVYHSNRFRHVDNSFPGVVAQAYGGNITKAAADTDDRVFKRVREWEIKQGREPQNWRRCSAENAVEAEDDG